MILRIIRAKGVTENRLWLCIFTYSVLMQPLFVKAVSLPTSEELKTTLNILFRTPWDPTSKLLKERLTKANSVMDRLYVKGKKDLTWTNGTPNKKNEAEFLMTTRTHEQLTLLYTAFNELIANLKIFMRQYHRLGRDIDPTTCQEVESKIRALHQALNRIYNQTIMLMQQEKKLTKTVKSYFFGNNVATILGLLKDASISLGTLAFRQHQQIVNLCRQSTRFAQPVYQEHNAPDDGAQEEASDQE
jgi:hypothetical protein